MSMDRVRAQRAYIDAADVEREATENIGKLESELERWQRIRDQARAVGATALAETTGQLPPDADVSSDPVS